MCARSVVIPCYHLVWYNKFITKTIDELVVIPCYHLVWYNLPRYEGITDFVVIPCYHLVWYNHDADTLANRML